MNLNLVTSDFDKIEKNYLTSHPFSWDWQENIGTTYKYNEFLAYIHKYIENNPAVVEIPFNSFMHIRGRNDTPLNLPKSMTLVEEAVNHDPYYITPSQNSFCKLLAPSGNSFVCISWLDDTTVGANFGAARFHSFVIRFVTKGDMIEMMKNYANYLIEEKEKALEKNFNVYSILDNEWDRNTIKDSQTLDMVFIKPSIKQTILDRVKTFQEEIDRCKRFGKPHKLNFLFYGVPGSGKTSLVKAIAKQLKKRLYIFNFSKELTDNRMTSLVKNIEKDSVIVFEDVDSFFINRESNGCNISFSSLINQLDGIRNSDSGLITILTANHVDKLDTALLRQGRIDLIIKFDYPDKEEVQMAFNAYLDHLSIEEREDLFKRWYPRVRGKKIPMSAFTDFFFRDYKNILEKTDMFLKEHEHLVSIQTNGNTEKMYL